MELDSPRSVNPEKLPHEIKVFRTMSSAEFHKYINGKQITPIIEKSEDALQDITTADTAAIWFSPDRLERFPEPGQEDSLVSEGLPALDFTDIRETWDLGRGGIHDPITNNLIVEFLTDKKPDVVYGKYGDTWVKEYTYPEYDAADFQVQRVYKLSDRQIIFDRANLPGNVSPEVKLAEIADSELAEEQDMEKTAAIAIDVLKKHAKDLPSPY